MHGKLLFHKCCVYMSERKLAGKKRQNPTLNYYQNRRLIHIRWSSCSVPSRLTTDITVVWFLTTAAVLSFYLMGPSVFFSRWLIFFVFVFYSFCSLNLTLLNGYDNTKMQGTSTPIRHKGGFVHLNAFKRT